MITVRSVSSNPLGLMRNCRHLHVMKANQSDLTFTPLNDQEKLAFKLSSTAKYALTYGKRKDNLLPLNTIIGFLHGEVKYDSDHDTVIADPSKFEENKTFLPVLHNFIKHNLTSSPDLVKKAEDAKTGWFNIIDHRQSLSRAVPSEDIFGFVQLNEGKMETTTYQAMPTHRLFTDEGPFLLDKYLHPKFKQYISEL